MERSFARFHHALRPGPAAGGDKTPAALDAAPFRERFMAAMDDDLNTPQALAALFDLAREINRARDGGQPVNAAQETLRELGGLLGLTFAERGPAAGAAQLAAQPFIDLLVSVRAELRQARQYAQADRIRDQLAAQGVTLEDTAEGTLWQYQRPG